MLYKKEILSVCLQETLRKKCIQCGTTLGLSLISTADNFNILGKSA